MSTNTVRIFFIPMIRRCGSILRDSQEFNRFTNSPVANYRGELYSLPFNMYTFNKMWGVVTPEEAAAKIEEQKKEACITEPKNLEEQAISWWEETFLKKPIKGYTEKQWGRDCAIFRHLSSSDFRFD